MRTLTPQGINDAPYWADSVFENRIGSLFYFDSCTGRFQSVHDKSSFGDGLSKGHYAFVSCKPIQRKKFNLSEHDFSDPVAEVKVLSSNDTAIVISHVGKWVSFSKCDIAAMAKEIKLTAEDLK